MNKHLMAMCGAVLLMAMGSATLLAQKVTYFDYSNYTFTYTEGGVTKPVKLTDEATTPDHIIALLKAVYTDPTIPGVWWGYDYGTTHKRRLNYNNYANQGTPWSKGNNTYADPEQDGMTLLLVQMKEGWTSGTPNGKSWSDKEYIANAYSSVKLITNFTRVHDENNPGYLYSIDGATNRFFFISKGKPRYTYTRPLHRLFEQISPVNTSQGSHATNSFIAEMRAGHTYLCYHDCGDVGTVGAGHWFTISQQGEAFSLKNLTIFIPDRRFEDNMEKDINDSNYFCYYGNSNHTAQQHNDLMPKVLMYTATLDATATPSQTTAGYYRVDLDWNTSFTHDKIGADVPEHFYVYILNEDNSRTLIEEVTKNEDGLVVTKHHDYLVRQTTEAQTIHYVVTAQTINRDNDGKIIMRDGKPLVTLQAETPVREVVIPGYSPFFTQASAYRSRFDIPRQVNVYKNTLAIHPTTQEDFDALQNSQEKYDVTRTDAQGNKLTIATVQFTQQEQGYGYQVEYNADTQVDNPVFDDEQPTLSGTISNFGSTVVIIDRFTASTETNDHSGSYSYQFEQDGKHFSNTLVVPVYKTTNDVEGVGYTLEQVKADTNHSLAARPTNAITFQAMYEPSANLVEYDVLRLDQDYNEFKLGKAENFNNSGEYHVFGINPDGHLNQRQADVKVQPQLPQDITIEDKNGSAPDETSRYVPVIITLYGGQQFMPNTYGCSLSEMHYPLIELTASNLIKTKPFAGVDRPVMAYSATLNLKPILPTDLKHVYYYRLWRVMDENDYNTILPEQTLLNAQADISGTTRGVEWGSNYQPIKQTYPADPNGVSVVDLFVDGRIIAGQSKRVTYIARLYATNVDGEAEQIDGPNRSRRAQDGKDYFVAEQRVTVDFSDENVITGIDSLAQDGEVTDVTYYNLMGVASSEPYAGINMVAVRYRDGRIVVSKLVR